MSYPSTHCEMLQDEALSLHALLCGASELLYAMPSEPSPARNALSALLTVMEERAEALAKALDMVNRPKALPEFAAPPIWPRFGGAFSFLVTNPVTSPKWQEIWLLPAGLYA